MTTVKTFCGAESVQRSTSKVLAPPGGKTNINLFGGGEAETSASKSVNQCQAARQQSHIFDSDHSPVKVNQHQALRQESHVFEKAQPGEKALHTSSKVIKAPGGGSSIKLG